MEADFASLSWTFEEEEELLLDEGPMMSQNPGIRILGYHAVTLQNLEVRLTTLKPTEYSWLPLCIFFLQIYKFL